MNVAGAALSSPTDALIAKHEIYGPARKLGIHLHPVKNDFSGHTAMDLLGVLIDTRFELFYSHPKS